MQALVPISLRALSVAAVVTVIACGDSNQPPAPSQPEVTIAPVEVDDGAIIKSTCDDITVSGTYRLAANLSCTGNPAFTITADNVLLGLRGYNITGNSSFNGPTINGNNVTIRGPGKIQQYQNGVQVLGTSFRVYNVEFLNDLNGAIHFVSTAVDGYVDGNTFSGGGYAGFSTAANSIRLVNNTFDGHTVAMLFNPASSGHLIRLNTVSNSSQYGLQLNASDSRVNNNTFSSSTTADIYSNCASPDVKFRNNNYSTKTCFP